RPGLTSIPPFRDTGGRYRGNGTARPRLGGRKRPRGRGRIVGRGPGPAGERPGRRYGSVRAGDLAGQMDQQGPGQGVLRVRGRYVPRRPVRSAQGDREGALLEAMQREERLPECVAQLVLPRDPERLVLLHGVQRPFGGAVEAEYHA